MSKFEYVPLNRTQVESLPHFSHQYTLPGDDYSVDFLGEGDGDGGSNDDDWWRCDSAGCSNPKKEGYDYCGWCLVFK